MFSKKLLLRNLKDLFRRQVNWLFLKMMFFIPNHLFQSRGGGKKNVIFCPTQEKTQIPNFPIEVAFSNKLSAISGLDEQNFIERV